MKEHHLPPGDFPDPAAFAEILGAWDLTVRVCVFVVRLFMCVCVSASECMLCVVCCVWVGWGGVGWGLERGRRPPEW
jgi:hypothetical protein